MDTLKFPEPKLRYQKTLKYPKKEGSQKAVSFGDESPELPKRRRASSKNSKKSHSNLSAIKRELEEEDEPITPVSKRLKENDNILKIRRGLLNLSNGSRIKK